MTMDTKVLNRTLANRIQQHTQRAVHPHQVGFIPEMKGGPTYKVNQRHRINKGKNSLDYLNRSRKSTRQNPTLFDKKKSVN